MNIFKRIYYYFIYINILKHNWDSLSSKEYMLIHDWIWRFGTVINLPTNIVTTYEDSFYKEVVKKYLIKANQKFYDIGLMEFVDVKVTPIDNYNIKVLFSYKYFNLKYFKNIINNIITISILGLIIYFILSLFF